MEKQKHHQLELSSQTIVILWAIIQSFGWAMIFLLATNISSMNYDAFILGFIGLLCGGLVGALQHTLIDHSLGVQLHRWLVFTAVGTAIGLASLSWTELWVRAPYLYILPVFVAPALLQWLSVRRYTRAGWLWIVANGIASMVFMMFLLLIQGQNQYFLSMVIPAGLQGIASGFVMVWLLCKLPEQGTAHEKAKVGYDNKAKIA